MALYLIEDAERALQESNSTFEWLENGDLVTISPILPAIRSVLRHEENKKKKMFFNSIVAAYKGWNDRRNEGSRAVRLGNGSYLNAADIERASEIMDEISVRFEWRAGDVLLLDNRVVMYALLPLYNAACISLY